MEQYGFTERRVTDAKKYADGYDDNNYEAAHSETDHYKPKIRRNNLIDLYLDDYNADEFVANHLYGAIDNLSVDVSHDELENLLSTSAQNLSQSFVKKVKKFNLRRDQVKKLTPFETYCALMKGYMVLSVLLVPKAFVNGGYGISFIFIAGSGCLSMLGVYKLIDAGLATKLYSYPLIVEKILGKNARIIIEGFIALTQFSFIISHVTFLIESCKSTIEIVWGLDTTYAWYIIAVTTIYTLLAWVRNLAHFSFTFLIGNILIIITVLYVAYYVCKMIHDDGIGPNNEFVNDSGVWNTLGFSIYCYEGIGVVMPVMATCDDPKNFRKIVSYAFATLITVYCTFGLICCLAFGSNMNESIVTQMIPSGNITIIIIKVIFCVNLLCSYAIVIYPTNVAVENWLCGCFKNSKNKLYWA